MVNNTKKEILRLLRTHTHPVSGEVMAKHISKSRVTVWKAIQSLVESGYLIEAQPTGYKLIRDIPDSLESWEFGENAKRFRHVSVADSTMNRAREAALSEAESGLIISANEQLEGKGTGDKLWESSSGGLFFTMVTRPELNIAYVHRSILAAQIASVKAIRQVTNTETQLAWPNDIILKDEKAGGILCESLNLGTHIKFSNIGVGINTGKTPSLKGTTTVLANKKDVLSAFVDEFDRIDTGSNDLIQQWTALCSHIGKTVDGYTTKGEHVSGIFSGITQYGWAIITTAEIDATSGGTIELPPGTFSLHTKGWKK